jgi:DNA polymerase I
MDALAAFTEIWCADFEFCAPDGERPMPICLVAVEVRTGQTVRLFDDELAGGPPWSAGPDVLFVAYYASAELGCCLALDWPMPRRVLDLFAEFRNITNGLQVPCGAGLLGALAYFGLNAIDGADKESMRQLAMRGGPYTEGERAALLDYCASDVTALVDLLPVMLPHIDLPRALLRGRYMRSAATIEWNGIPVDVETLTRLRADWDRLKSDLIRDVAGEYDVFTADGDGPLRFSSARFADWLVRNGIPWPRLDSGALDLSDDTFRQMARLYPLVAPLRELRYSLSQLRLNSLAVGSDGRNRCLLSSFRSTAGRNQPSNAKFIFGPSCWLRALIQPAAGRAVAYVDWEQQEFGIAAALSGDQNMWDAYASGDPYLTFAKQAAAVPADATKETHKAERDQFKVCALAVQYGMGELSLSQSIGKPVAYARELLRLHRQTYPRFWEWSQSAVDHAMLHGWLQTVFGWRVRVGVDANPRSLANFPMQANGAEMLRLACCLATEARTTVCAPVHDAVLIEADAEDINAEVERMQALMREASEVVLSGFPLRTDAKVIRHPDRYLDGRGVVMWEHVSSKLDSLSEHHRELKVVQY